MTIKETVLKAVEGGYSLEDETDLSPEEERLFLDPLFWKCLGKAMHWDSLILEILDEEDEGKMIDPNEWVMKWHDFIEHLRKGGDIKSFFQPY